MTTIWLIVANTENCSCRTKFFTVPLKTAMNFLKFETDVLNDIREEDENGIEYPR